MFDFKQLTAKIYDLAQYINLHKFTWFEAACVSYILGFTVHIHIQTIGPPTNIRVSYITDTSFLVQWDAVYRASWYIVSWSGVNKASTRETLHWITGLTPNTSYTVTVEAVGFCDQYGTPNDTIMVTTSLTESSSSVMPIIIPTSLVNSKTATATPTGN